MANILLVSHCDFPSNSAVHVHHFANGLVALGEDCVVCVPHDRDTAAKMEQPRYRTAQFSDIDTVAELFANQQPPELVHAWTPREHVRRFCQQLEERYRFRLVVHLEDNEEHILEAFTQQPLASLEAVPPSLSHPRRYREFLDSADGVTVIMDRLQEFVCDRISTILLWPGVDLQQFAPRAKDTALADKIGLPPEATVLAYTGHVHPANVEEVRELYRAVGQRNRQQRPTVLIRTGTDQCPLLPEEEQWIEQYVIELGFVPRADIADVLALADVLVQPGRSDAFNDYRFPSKIPEFLAMGKPVVLPATNIGRFLSGEQAIVLPEVTAATLVEAIDRVASEPDLAETLGAGARQFAQQHLSWDVQSQQLQRFYQAILAEEDLSSWQQGFSRLQRQAQAMRQQLQQTQQQEQHTAQQLQQTREQEQRTAQQLQQIQQRLKHVETQYQQAVQQLQQTQEHLHHLQRVVQMMRQSKFWQLQERWSALRRRWQR